MFMPEKDWAPLCNMVFEALTIAEATGGGAMLEKEKLIHGKGTKARMSRDMIASVVIKQTGFWPNDQGGTKASEEDIKWAQNYKPCRDTTK